MMFHNTISVRSIMAQYSLQLFFSSSYLLGSYLYVNVSVLHSVRAIRYGANRIELKNQVILKTGKRQLLCLRCFKFYRLSFKFQ